MNQTPKVLAVITDEELKEIQSLDDALIDANNAVYDWFNSMADKYGFSKEVQCHVDLDSKTIREGYREEDESEDMNQTETQGQLSSETIAEMHLDGTLCEQCGTYLGEAIGHPVVCEGCKK